MTDLVVTDLLLIVAVVLLAATVVILLIWDFWRFRHPQTQAWVKIAWLRD